MGSETLTGDSFLVVIVVFVYLRGNTTQQPAMSMQFDIHCALEKGTKTTTSPQSLQIV